MLEIAAVVQNKVIECFTYWSVKTNLEVAYTLFEDCSFYSSSVFCCVLAV